MRENQKLESTEYLDFNPNNIINSGNNGNSNKILDNIPNNKSNISAPNLNVSLLNEIRLESSSDVSIIQKNNHSEIISPPESLVSFIVKSKSATSGDSVDILNDLNNYIFDDGIIGENDESILFDKEIIPNLQINENNNINKNINLKIKVMKEKGKEEVLLNNNGNEEKQSKSESEIQKYKQELKRINKEKEYINMMKKKLDERAKKLKDQEAKIYQKISFFQKKEMPKKEYEKEGASNIGKSIDDKKEQNSQRNYISDKWNNNNNKFWLKMIK